IFQILEEFNQEKKSWRITRYVGSFFARVPAPEPKKQELVKAILSRLESQPHLKGELMQRVLKEANILDPLTRPPVAGGTRPGGEPVTQEDVKQYWSSIADTIGCKLRDGVEPEKSVRDYIFKFQQNIRLSKEEVPPRIAKLMEISNPTISHFMELKEWKAA